MEKVTIPKYVAEYIEEWKEEGFSLSMVLEFSDDTDERDTMKWLYDNRKIMNDQHVYLFVRAWVEGYEVEEKLYRVIVGGETDKSFVFLNELGFIGSVDTCEFVPRLTEKQIKAIDERYWAFAEEVK